MQFFLLCIHVMDIYQMAALYVLSAFLVLQIQQPVRKTHVASILAGDK